MKEYETKIELISNGDEHKYVAHVKLVGSDEILFSSKPHYETENALRETQRYFLKQNVANNQPINSSIKNFNQETLKPEKKCCGR